MKILWVKAGKLLPVDTGGKIRSYNILRYLSQEHSLTLLSYYGGERDRDYESALAKEIPGSEAIHTGAPDSGAIGQALHYLPRLAKAAPYAVSKFTDTRVSSTVAASLASRRFDVAICDFLSASGNFPFELKTPCLLFQHNVESSLWQRMAATESSPLLKMSYRIEAGKMARYEKATIGRFHHVIAVSDHDRQQMLQMDPTCEITVVPTGVDTRKFKVAMPSAANPPRIVFTGSMDWEPNIDAMDYFCAQIWPGIKKEFPAAIFQIVGRNPAGKVRKLASESIEVTGTVPSVEEYLENASVVVVPLRIGGGTRLKIFEAMAMGKALVSTTIGAEGLDIESGRDLLLADDPAAFGDAIRLLLRDDGIRHKLERAAVETAGKYDWSRVAAQFADVLRRVAETTAVAAARPAPVSL